MKFKIDQDYHIHTYLSSCSNDPEQNLKNIINAEKENGIKDICITDHFWDENVEGASGWYQPQNFTHISKIKPIPEIDGIKVRFGCETDMDKFFTVGVSKEKFDEFEFIIVPTTHLHMVNFTLTAEDAKSNKRRAELWVERFEKLMELDLPFHKIGLAHPACSLMAPRTREDYLEVLSLISDEDMERLFSKAAKLKMGIEINSYDMKFHEKDTDAVLRMFKIAKNSGCKFYLGSDAHHMDSFCEAIPYYERVIDILNLTEDDKFKLPD